MSLWDEVRVNLADWYTVATDKTGEMARVGLRKYDRFGISRDVERQFAELGSFVYNALGEERDDVLTDPTLVAIVERIRELEAELQRKDEEIGAIREAYTEKASRRQTAEAPQAASAAEDIAEADFVEVTPTPAPEAEVDADGEVEAEAPPSAETAADEPVEADMEDPADEGKARE